MLKSTHKAAGLKTSSSLPEGWTEHTAPSGHKYYYNASTKQSTYTRPVFEDSAQAQHEEPLFAEEAGPDPIMLATLRAQEEFARNAAQAQPGHFTGGKSYQQRPQRRGHGGDRPKRKKAIPGCEPWVLIYTKFGRRFVHNLETRESLWKFPQEVMMAVIEMESKEWKAKNDGEKSKDSEDMGKTSQPTGSTSEPQPQATVPSQAKAEPGYDSSEYEEVEVTDDEVEGITDSNKRPRLSSSPSNQPTAPGGPAEMTEDDIAWQLAQMEASDDDYDAAYDNLADSPQQDATDPDGEDPGLEITQDDNLALFRSLLDDTATSPYATFESLLDLPRYYDDSRWLALPNMATRREAFIAWSRDRVADLKAQQALKQDEEEGEEAPMVGYLRFLSEKATPKLYWPEFKRKWKKEGVMRDYEPSEKEREKVYRDFVGRLKAKSTGERRKELGSWLKGVDKGDGGKGKVPKEVLRDVRYWVVAEREREEVVGAWLGTGR